LPQPESPIVRSDALIHWLASQSIATSRDSVADSSATIGEDEADDGDSTAAVDQVFDLLGDDL
jgi:hypothetical protein